jgi:hypothetical protein
LGGFLSNELGNVAFFVNGLSVLIGLALFKLHGFSANDAPWTPLAFGNMFGSLNDLGHGCLLGETVPTLASLELKD